jgi:hypothetical protein
LIEEETEGQLLSPHLWKTEQLSPKMSIF